MQKLTKVLLALVFFTSVVGCSTTKPSVKNPQDDIVYDELQTSELVIVGAGGAGLASAIEAVEHGAESVILIEMTGKTGGSLNYTSGSLSGAETKIQALDGIVDTKESFVQDILKNGAQKGNEELIRMFVEEDTKAVDWLWDNGLSGKTFQEANGKKSVFAPEHALYSVPRTYKARPDDAKKYKSAAHEILDQVLAEYSDEITVIYNTEATELVPNADGQVLSVVAKNSDTGKVLRLDATKGIIMSTGGYSGNGKLMGEYAKYGNEYLVGGTANANGASLLTMQKVGAKIDDTNMSYIPTFPMGLEVAPGMGIIAPTYTWKAGGICINQEGKRFVDETESNVEIREVALEQQTNAIQYDIFTPQVIEDLKATHGDMFYTFFYAPGMPHSAHVVEADSLDELATKLNVPAENLKATVETYNKAVETKITDEFGREFTEESLNTYSTAINKIDGDKFYAVPLKALVVMTLGGVSVNNQMQVIDEKGVAIPGLYAAGEVVGGVWGKFVSGGTGVMGPIAFGRIAARNVLTAELGTKSDVKAASKLLDANLFVKDVVVAEAYDMSGIKDGTYKITVDGQNGPMEIEVIVASAKIANVNIVSHNETAGISDDAIAKVPASIVSGNTPNVDTISGATLTSNRIMDAVKAALDQSKK